MSKDKKYGMHIIVYNINNVQKFAILSCNIYSVNIYNCSKKHTKKLD